MQKTNIKVIIILCMIGIFDIIVCFKYDIGIPCVFFELTGIYCPGCGATRAITSLIKLNFYQALRYNMLIIILLVFSIIYYAYKYILKSEKKLPNYIWYILLIITILFGILRNIPIFYYLAPTKII